MMGRPYIIVNGMRPCLQCREMKPVDAFHLVRKGGTSRRSRCKECVSIRKKPVSQTINGMRNCLYCGNTKPEDAFYEYIDRGIKKRMGKCKDCYCKYQRDLKINRYGSLRAERRMRRYGLTQEEIDRMIEKQGGICPICAIPLNTSFNVVVDHCHKTNTNRAIVCRQCNIGLGHIKDNLDIVRKIAEYLERHQEK